MKVNYVKNSNNSQKTTCVGVFFLTKLKTEACNLD